MTDRYLVPASPGDRQDLGTYLARADRLDPGGYVRLRRHSGDPDRTVAWLVVLGVVVRRDFGARLVGVEDVTVSSRALASSVALSVTRPEGAALPVARDDEWRASLPPTSGWRHREDVPARLLRDAVTTSADSLRDGDAATVEAAGEAMLSLAVVTVTDDGERLDLPLRQVLAASRMGYLPEAPGDADVARIATAGPWTVLATPQGAVFRRTATVDLLGLR